MPKQRITKEMVVDAAFELAREFGLEKITVKEIAQKLGCSVQPIYSYCENMDGLRKNVTEKAKSFVGEYIASNINKDDFFRSTGHSYVKLAKEEPHIFQIYVMHKRENIASLDELYSSESNPQVANFIAKALNISFEKAKMLHLNMLIYTVGIGTILATTSDISTDEITEQLEMAYKSFLKQAKEN